MESNLTSQILNTSSSLKKSRILKARNDGVDRVSSFCVLNATSLDTQHRSQLAPSTLVSSTPSPFRSRYTSGACRPHRGHSFLLGQGNVQTKHIQHMETSNRCSSVGWAASCAFMSTSLAGMASVLPSCTTGASAASSTSQAGRSVFALEDLSAIDGSTSKRRKTMKTRT